MMSSRIAQVFVFIASCCQINAFVPSIFTQNGFSRKDASALHMSQQEKTLQPYQVYPVISRIAGMNWTGTCRYVGADLVPLSKLKLTGGVRYDINGTSVTLSSFLTFPNGNTREVQMRGKKEAASSSPVMTLRSVEEGGPIRMHLTEVGSDTILINEVEEATGKIILTSSLSITQGASGMELVGVSHEVGEGKESIEGHQIWRLVGGPVEFDDFDYRDGTGW